MRRILLLPIMLGLFLLPCSAQTSGKGIKSKSRFADVSEVSSERTIDYSATAVFKIASRKSEYHFGDLISIDVAMLNKSKQFVNFLDLGRFAQISVKDSNENEIKGGIYMSPLLSPKFNLIGSGEYDSETVYLLIGCGDVEKKYSHTYQSMEDDFDKNHFASYGNGCLKITKAGKYLIQAEINNKFVDEEDKTKKTAIGTIESLPLEILVTE